MAFRSTLDPKTGRVPDPISKRRGRYGGVSLAVHSRNKKHKAIARVELLPLWQCCRMFLTLCINLGRGERCRSWWSDRHMAEEMSRSGQATYSIGHVRKCRRFCEDVGLLRSTYVPPHSHYGCLGADKCPCGHFPSPKTPDVDGGGAKATKGGRIVEVNLDAVLGLADLWQGPLREMGWHDAREAREAIEADEPAPEPKPATAAPAGHCAAAQCVRMDDPGRVIMDAHSCDLHPASQDGSLDHGRSVETRSAPGQRVPRRGTERPAAAGGPAALRAPCDAAPTAAVAALDAPPPSGPPRPPEPRRRPLEGSGEHAPGHGSSPAKPARSRAPMPEQDMLSVFAKMVPRGVAAFVADNLGTMRPVGAPETRWTEGAGPAPVAAEPPGARTPNVGLLFGASHLRAVGRNGERPPGWRGGGAGEPRK